jgi:hypothetical protein
MLARNLVLVSWAAMCLYGCGSASTKEEGWAYVGTDATLKSPAYGPIGNMTPETRQAQIQAAFEAWRQKNRNAVEASKDACASETGDSKAAGTWTGYSSAFMACMKAQGWIRVSNPL